MSKKLIVTMAVMSFALCGMAFAAVENIKVSGDIHAEVFTRDFALGAISLSAKDHESLFSQIRLRFDADLTEGVSAVLRLISEEGWGERGTSNNLKVDLGYVEMKEFLYQPLTLVIGKQELRYGNGLIVGNPDTNQGKVSGSAIATNLPSIVADLSLLKSFDAVKAILDFSPWTLDLVFAQVDEGNTNSRADDELLIGGNLAYKWGSYNGLTELYFFNADKAPQSTQTTTHKDYVSVVGTRTQLDLNDNITLGVEGAFQFGDYYASSTDNDRLRAWAGQFTSEYRFLNSYNAKIGLGYTYLSGDKPSSTERYEGWNPLWEDQTPAEIINVLQSNTNASLLTLSGSMMPREDVTLGLVYCRSDFAKKLGTTSYTPTIGPASGYAYSVKTNKKHFGDEVDVYGLYDYTEDVQLKLSAAYFIPGAVFNQGNHKNAYSVRAGVNVDF